MMRKTRPSRRFYTVYKNSAWPRDERTVRLPYAYVCAGDVFKQGQIPIILWSPRLSVLVFAGTTRPRASGVVVAAIYKP